MSAVAMAVPEECLAMDLVGAREAPGGTAEMEGTGSARAAVVLAVAALADPAPRPAGLAREVWEFSEKDLPGLAAHPHPGAEKEGQAARMAGPLL